MLLILSIFMACIKPHESKYSCNCGAHHFKNISWVMGDLIFLTFLVFIWGLQTVEVEVWMNMDFFFLNFRKQGEKEYFEPLSKGAFPFPIWNMIYLYCEVFMELIIFLCILSRTNNFELFGLWTYKYYFFSSLISVKSFGLAFSFQQRKMGFKYLLSHSS